MNRSRTARLLARWGYKRKNGRHAARAGAKPKPAGPVFTWHWTSESTGWGMGPGYATWKRSRRTVGLHKPKRRTWRGQAQRNRWRREERQRERERAAKGWL